MLVMYRVLEFKSLGMWVAVLLGFKTDGTLAMSWRTDLNKLGYVKN